MASPSFVYAFDNLGPDKFVELCGLLLGARYKGFLLSSPGPDGGIDGENDPLLGELRTEQSSLLVDTVLPKDGLIVFQFKHKVVARVGEVQSRNQLLQLYVSNKNKESEVNKSNVIKSNPQAYVLVTNVEVNSNFRRKFIDQCKSENSNIKNYQIIGLDELEGWVISERSLRSQYFPMIFGKPRFDLKLKLVEGFTYKILNPERLYQGGESDCEPKEKILCLSVMNIGESTSYLASIKFKVLINGEIRYLMRSPLPKGCDPLANPPPDEPIHPGKCLEFRFYFEMFRKEFELKQEYYLSEVMVWDQIDNQYSLEISDRLREQIIQFTTNDS
jgi:hypothetical protein